jgi:cytochrome c553
MRKHTILAGAVAGLAVLAGTTAQAAELAKAQVDFFENKIRPILADTCYKCHNAGEGKVKGGLALDSKEATLKGGDTGPAVVPGDADKSLLIKAITYKDPDLQMPPKGEKLSDAQIADLIAWVKMGAPDPRSSGANAKFKGKTDAAKQHWAFAPVQKQTPPTVKAASRVKTPVDNFIFAKLEEKSLEPNAPAERDTLIRRAYYDLIGIPPTPAEVASFVNDKDPKAFEKIVEKLLASPHYGERWGRYWLDVARYSDTKGASNRREDPRFPYAWTYRDYVIKSFNEDKPFDKFIIEQVAADKLATSDPTLLAGLGFLTLGDRFDGNANDVINDRIDVVTKGFLGLTVACARCHDHMFDPIPTKDYYSLHGVFNSSMEPKEMPLIEKVDTNGAQYRAYVAERNRKLTELHRFADREINKLTSEFRKKAGAYLTVTYLDGKARTELDQKAKLDRNVVQATQNRIRRAGDRDPVIGPWNQLAKAWKASEKTFPAEAKKILTKVIENKPEGKKKTSPYNSMVALMFKRNPMPTTLAQAGTYYTGLFTAVDAQWQATLKAYESSGRFPAPFANAQMEEIRNTPFRFTTSSTMEINEVVGMVPVGLQGRIRNLANELSRLEVTHPGAPARAVVLVDKPKPVDSPVFVRGEPGNKGQAAPRQFLEILSGPNRQPFKIGSGRLELAKAIAGKSNPLTARVLVNRVWLHHFGEGIVTTPDDFGTMADAPSHPELLDYLANHFVESGWSIKKLHRLIMLSETYQQSSDTNPRFAQVDPYNRLLWRANIRKLEFEAIRDSLLSIGGKLDLELGGKPVNITAEPYSDRRSVYGYIDRANVPEVMTHFDFATPDMPTGKRYNTIVPQQALFMMNSPQVIDVTRNIVARPEFKTAKTDEARLEALYNIIYQRKARPEEIKLGLEFVHTKSTDPVIIAQPQPVSAVAAKKAPPKKAPAPTMRSQGNGIINSGAMVERRGLSNWEKYAQTLLLANEFSYVN